jgi:hypothetical protein
MSECVADTLLTTLVLEPETPLLLGLFVSDLSGPDSDVRTREVTAPEYSRQPVRFEVDEPFVTNQNDIQFPRSADGWGMLTHIGVFDTDGRMLLYKSMGGVHQVGAKRQVGFPAGGLELYVRRNYVRKP